MKKVELLAPAGNMDSLKAAVMAGCDAVYLGGVLFGARAFAGNFTNEEIVDAINYAHLYGVKVYVTINTIIYDSEVERFLDYVRFLHKNNVDAVIIQDIGMFDLLRKKFPNLELHASTQMNIHNYDGALLAKKLGFKRVVMARETPIDVIKKIKEEIDIEIEVFIHGALCVSYSGEWLPRLTMSASILADIYKYGNVNISGDAIADALHNMVSEDKHHEGEVATDLELASLAAVLAKVSNGALANGKKICDPAAGSGNLICSSINIFNAEPNQLIANDINPKLIELLSLRLGLSFPKVIAKPNVAQITTEDIVNLNKSDFKDVDVVLLNPPFVAGINCVNRKVPFYNKIKSLKGSEAITKVGQMNLGAVFLETVCHLVNVGTTIVCIFPKAHLTERGEEAVAFRRMLLNLFGLHTIFNYPAEGLFDSVTEEKCIYVGKVLQKTKEVLVYSSDVKVADIDLHALQSVTSGYCRKDFATVFPGVEARVFDWSELDTAVEDGWRMVCSEMSEAIEFANKSFWMNDKPIPLSDSTSNKKCGSTDRGGVYVIKSYVKSLSSSF